MEHRRQKLSNMVTRAVFLTTLVFLLQVFHAFSSIKLAELHNEQPCNGTIADCNKEEEFTMDSEISRRILAQAGHISYDAVGRNQQPACGTGARGDSYGRSCLSHPVNPSGRPCTRFQNRCRDN